jgi:predicted RNA methylase
LSKNDAGPNTTILDLGCGVGMLGIAFALVKSDVVYLLDCDEDALVLAKENLEYLEEKELVGSDEGGCLGLEIIRAKVKYVKPKGATCGGGRGKGGRGRGHGRGSKGRGKSRQQLEENAQSNRLDLTIDDGIPLPSKMVDTVITNPPFGTKNNDGIDVQFLKTSIRLARRAVYSFHKSSTRPYLLKLIQSWGLSVEVVAKMKFDIQNMYKFHKEKVKDVEVDLIRVFWDDVDKEEGVVASRNEAQLEESLHEDCYSDEE